MGGAAGRAGIPSACSPHLQPYGRPTAASNIAGVLPSLRRETPSGDCEY